MKNIYRMILCLSIVAGSFLSCEKGETSIQGELKTYEDISNLANDEIFINLVVKNMNLINQISDINNVKNLTSKNYELTNDELNDLSKSLGFKDLNSYKQFYKSESKALMILNNRYNLEIYDKSKIQELAIEGFNNKYQFKVTNNCERIRRNCLISAAAGATIGHFGCASLDITVVAGLVCHGAVLVIQAAVSDTCNADAEDCQAGIQ